MLINYYFRKIHIFYRLIDRETPNSRSVRFGWHQYNDLESIYRWLDRMLKKYPDILTNYNYGTSYENRTLRAIKLSHKSV